MKVSIDLVDIVFDRLKEENVDSLISGNIYKYSRPVNSDKEDIVINSLPVTNQKIQRGLVNVNVHVPNLSINIGGIQDRSTPNLGRLRTLSKSIGTIFQELWYDDYLVEVQTEQILPDGSNHFSNIRLSFYSPQN